MTGFRNVIPAICVVRSGDEMPINIPYVLFISNGSIDIIRLTGSRW